MTSVDHKRILDHVVRLDGVPSERPLFSEWITAESHLGFLRQNAMADEIAIHVSGEFSFVHSVVVRNGKLYPIDFDDLLNWSITPYGSIAGYVTGGGRKTVRVHRGFNDSRARSLDGATPLVFGRTFEGWTDQGRNYFEVHQEYSHITDIHWRPEYRAYCRYDGNGDLESVVSITNRDESGTSAAVVSFRWEPLEEYLVASRATLVRMFDFTLYRRSEFGGWGDVKRRRHVDDQFLFYDQGVLPAHAAYTRGVQIIKPRRSMRSVYAATTSSWSGNNDKQHVEFIAHDWRNDRIVSISTDPRATTNYFAAGGNALPFELSPAFFKPEVFLKYKGDRDKYTIGERGISCRSAWHLEGYDVNEAGQVHAYICDLRRLPYPEKLHWLSYNEPPKAGLSERALINDFKGEWTAVLSPLQEVLSITRRWRDKKVLWWKLRDERLLDRITTPISDSRDEWAEAFMDLAKLIVEGFETKAIRAELNATGLSFEDKEGSLALLEKLITDDSESGESRKLAGLRTVQNLRSKVKGHVGGGDSERLARSAIEQHGTYGNHFRFVCGLVTRDLETIERRFRS